MEGKIWKKRQIILYVRKTPPRGRFAYAGYYSKERTLTPMDLKGTVKLLGKSSENELVERDQADKKLGV
jgi:hypothetical protein